MEIKINENISLFGRFISGWSGMIDSPAINIYLNFCPQKQLNLSDHIARKCQNFSEGSYFQKRSIIQLTTRYICVYSRCDNVLTVFWVPRWRILFWVFFYDINFAIFCMIFLMTVRESDHNRLLEIG